MSEPIFDQLQAEFVEQSKFVRLQIGPPIGEGFEQIEVVDEHFGMVGHVNRMIEIEEVPTPNPDFVESIVYALAEAKLTKPRLYMVGGAPELVDIRPKLIAELDETMVIPVFEDDTEEPPNDGDDTLFISPVEEPEKPQESDPHVFPIKSQHKAYKSHKKLSATSTFGWFVNRAA